MSLSPDDPLIKEIERGVALDSYVRWDETSEFVEDLEPLKSKIDNLIDSGEAKRAVGLFEIFIAACYAKADEIDDRVVTLVGLRKNCFARQFGPGK